MELNITRIPSLSKYFFGLIPFLRLIPRIMANADGGALELLLRRLKEAERRAKLLNYEVKQIRQEIAIVKTELITHTTLTNNNDEGSGHNRVVPSPRQSILSIPSRSLPSTSRTEVDYNVEADEPPTRKRMKATFTKENDYIVVYTDGACENNGASHAKAGIGIWFGENHPLNISKPVEGKATNNTAEIQACIQALKTLKDQGETKVKIITDSQFTINCITKWIINWKRNNWRTATGAPVKNKEDLQKLDAMRNCFVDVEWCHVYGHKGVIGNEEADKLARQGALLYKPCI